MTRKDGQRVPAIYVCASTQKYGGILMAMVKFSEDGKEYTVHPRVVEYEKDGWKLTSDGRLKKKAN